MKSIPNDWLPVAPVTITAESVWSVVVVNPCPADCVAGVLVQNPSVLSVIRPTCPKFTT